MNIPQFSINRPITVTCIFILSLIMGLISFNKIGVDLYPDVSFPIVSVTVGYAGASPTEIESLVTKPLEDDLSTISGIKSIKSTNKEGNSVITIEFSLETDIRFAEQKIKDRVSSIRYKLPQDIDEPLIRTFDPSDSPVLVITMSADLKEAELYDLASIKLKSEIEQVDNIGYVNVVGGRKREIQVELDSKKMDRFQVSATQVSTQLNSIGKNIPAGTQKTLLKESVIKTVGEFETLPDIAKTVVSFYGNESVIKLSDIAEIKDGLEEEKTKTYVNGLPALSLMIYKQSGANTLEVVKEVKKRLDELEGDYKSKYKNFEIGIVRDGGKPIQANIDDVKETIVLGIILTVLVVLFFLGSLRSTFITGIAIPNSLLASFILMLWAGFTLNVMTLLAISLAIGLLIDDAIVVRENIYRHLEMGKSPFKAALEGTLEVQSAVIATTLTILSVFGPIAFMEGMVSQFFKEFGLTICFIIIVSTIDALTMAPMLSAYFVEKKEEKKSWIGKPFRYLLSLFDKFQSWLEKVYEKVLHFTLKRPLTILLLSAVISAGSLYTAIYVPKTFTPPQDTGEFVISLEAATGGSLNAMDILTKEVDGKIRAHKQVKKTVVTVGNYNGENNVSEIFVQLVSSKERELNTSGVKELMREEMKSFPQANPKVMDAGGEKNQQPFIVNLVGSDLKEIKKGADELFAKIKDHPDLKDVDISYKPGSPEIQVSIDRVRSQQLGLSSNLIGRELRTLIEGTTPAVFRANNEEYDIRLRLKESDRDLKENFSTFLVPNINGRLVRLRDAAKINEVVGPSAILRQDRGRYIMISAGINPDGNGLSKPMQDVGQLVKSGEVKLPPGVRMEFSGQAESFQEMTQNMGFAVILAMLLMYLVLSSLYESFITPFTIMLVIPLAACGAIYALAIFNSTLDIFSIIGCILLLGIATKNSILLIEYTEQLEKEGVPLKEAIVKAGVVRLRPILMTAFSLLAGMLPVAVGLNEASSQRTSMGIAVIGGTITSTVLTLVVVPAAYQYIEKFKLWLNAKVISRYINNEK